ncbi:hypothetical protein CMI37_21070, partial [Candidatus Pacearchaeota archaeon]|nr:hypothetical protein [Candidatus Pacearchaeota archaeon]
MASKKVFTSLEFGAGSTLIKPKIEVKEAAHLVTNNDPYFPGVAGQLAFGGDTELYLNDGTAWRKLHNSNTAFSTSSLITSTVADGSVPFAITSKTVVPNLTVEALGTPVGTPLSGFHVRSTTATEHGIPVYGTNGILKVGTPVADDDASSKGYVDNAVQGLDHKESVKYTTTGNLTSAAGIITTGLSNANIDTTTNPLAGDRILVKNQTNASENGIWLATGSSWTRATDADVTGTQLIEGGSFSSTSDITDGTPNNWQSVNSATLTSEGSGVSGNCLRVQTTSGNDGAAYQDITTVVGKSYRISLYMNKGTSGTVAYLVGIASDTDSILGASDTDSTASGWVLHESVFKATATTTRITLISRDSASTDYSEFDSVSVKETDLSEGAFVFVEDGTTLPNTSWVLSNGVTHAWTQFSGAGQITAGDGLAKSGDTLSVDLAASTPLEFASNKLSMAAIDTGDLANDAVDADKLDDSATFAMAGLRVGASALNGVITSKPTGAFTTSGVDDDFSAAALYVDNSVYGSSDSVLGGIMFSQRGNASDKHAAIMSIADHVTDGDPTGLAFYTQPLTSGSTAYLSEVLRLSSGGKVGIGGDFTNAAHPLGTLHVSTARYGGTELNSNVNFNSNIDGWDDYDSGTASHETTTTYNSSAGALRGTSDGTNIWLARSDGLVLTQGASYRITAKCYIPAGWDGGDVWMSDGGSFSGAGAETVVKADATTTGSWQSLQTDIPVAADVNGNIYLRGSNNPTNGKYVIFDDISIKEDDLADGVSTLGDDLVVSGSSGTGISIISKANTSSNLYFGDGIQKDYIRITGSRSIVTGDANGDSTLYFQASDGGAAPASVMSLYGADKSVKIEGGLGIGTDAGTRTFAINQTATNA